MKRTYFIDNLKIALTVLVIIHHTAIGYGASGGWCYVTTDVINGWSQLTLSAFLTINQAFFMSLFFFISAYFTPDSFDNKGLKKYLSGRLIRLGIPLLIYSAIINPCLNYGILLHTSGVNANLIDYIITFNVSNPSTSHLWFVLALLIFEVSYALHRKFSTISISKHVSDQIPSHLKISLFIIITGFLAFFLRTIYPIGGKNIIGLQLGYFVLYISMYLLGILANRKRWLDSIILKKYKVWVVIAFITIPFIFLAWINVTENPDQITQYIGGLNWKALFLAFWEAIVCVGLIVFFIMSFRRYLNISNTFSLNMAMNSYTAYIIHPLIVVGTTIMFELIPLQPFYKFIIVSLCSISLTFMFAHFIRMIPGIKKVI